MKRFLIVLSLLLMTNIAFAAPYKGDAKTARIPAGTRFDLEFMQTVDTMVSQDGDVCNFILLNDQKSGNNVVLPAGSIVRGCLSKVKPSKICSRGGVVYLDFDHIVTPTGRQLPLSLGLVGITQVTYDGGIYGSLGYGQALKDNWAKTVDITIKSTNYGLKAGESAPGIQYLTAPVCAVGGGFGAGCYLVGSSTVDLFKHGKDVTFIKGTKLQTQLTQPIDVPVN